VFNGMARQEGEGELAGREDVEWSSGRVSVSTASFLVSLIELAASRGRRRINGQGERGSFGLEPSVEQG
jgi:hypothetical protein